MLKTSPGSNAWATIFKNAEFSQSSLKVTTLSKFKLFSYLKKKIRNSIIKKMTFIVSAKPNSIKNLSVEELMFDKIKKHLQKNMGPNLVLNYSWSILCLETERKVR